MYQPLKKTKPYRSFQVMGTLHLLGKLSGKSMYQSQVKGKFILFTNLWIHNGCGRPQFQYIHFQSEFTTVWITNCSLAWSNRVLFKEIMDNACEYIYVLLFKKKKKKKSCFLENKLFTYQCIIKNDKNDFQIDKLSIFIFLLLLLFFFNRKTRKSPRTNFLSILSNTCKNKKKDRQKKSVNLWLILIAGERQSWVISSLFMEIIVSSAFLYNFGK